MITVQEITAKSIINKSKIFDYCLNGYVGCQLNCRYCYARLFMKRYSGHTEAWGQFVDVKMNAPALVRRQIRKLKTGTIWISSVCDPYQPLEEKYQITRQCLQELLEHPFPLNIQTKSPLVLRDLDLLQQFPDLEVGFTITTDDEQIRELFEPQVVPIEERLAALAAIHEHGIKTFVFLGPLLPGNPEKLVALFDGKADRILIDKMNYSQTLIKFYRTHNLAWALDNNYLKKYKTKLIAALQERKMSYEIFF
ncbi:radical SAM protein [candidate division CSSED10-310 bacterium]|uniref:Radical SAM protein n=1 Tax=candidate division CSSED10-310 bacterium TaxID=2855610 RepID=A0ABV6YT17_UNCC1